MCASRFRFLGSTSDLLSLHLWGATKLMLSICGAVEDFLNPLHFKEIKPVNPKGNQPWIFIGRTDAEAEAPILWPPDAKNWLIIKDPDAGKDWREEEKGTAEDEMVDGITDSVDMNLSQLWEIVKDRGAWRVAVHGVAKSRTQFSGWTTAKGFNCHCRDLH